MSEIPYDRLTVGLIGDKLSHSHSPIIHEILGNAHYNIYELNAEELDDFFYRRDFHAINVTIPYKKEVIKYCEAISPTAKLCNSVNTILNRNGKLYGYNTDFIGLIAMFKFYEIDVNNRKCVVLGSGGAGSTAVNVMEKLGAKKVVTVSRSGEYNYSNLDKISDFDVLINSTPVGLYGRNNDMPIDLNVFSGLEVAVDLIANPYRTELISLAQRLGIKGAGGDAMLFAQAVAGSALFFDQAIDFYDFGRLYGKYRRTSNNVVLIGMPSSGKSTLGKILAEKLRMKLIDIDSVIEQKAGMRIPKIFDKYGEKVFRDMESESIVEACKEKGCIIVTGGGAIEREENRLKLRRSGMVFWINRPLELLNSKGRPVSIRDGVEAIFNRRKVFYDECSDFEVKNETTPQRCCNEIISKFYGSCVKAELNMSEFTELV